MKTWPISERPCEKLLASGAPRLSDAELLAVLIRHGQKERNALVIAHELLHRFSSLRGVVSANKHDFCTISGVGEVKYAQLQAALEIIKRQYENKLKTRPVFDHVKDVESYVRCHLRDQIREVFGILMLDAQHQLITFRELFLGTLNAAVVYPREVVKSVLDDNAGAVILVHNHPSGIAEPSQADILITQDIKQALALIDVAVLDHLIVADSDTVSLVKRGLL